MPFPKAMLPQEFLNKTVLGNSVWDYLISLGVFTLIMTCLSIFKGTVLRRIKKMAERTRTDVDDLIVEIIQSIAWPFYVILSLYIASRFIWIPTSARSIVYYLFIIGVAYYLVKAVNRVIEFGATVVVEKKQKEIQRFDPSLIAILARIFKAVVWISAALIILQNFGYNISTLVAGLGIGGVAIAFALQNILSDIFASFSIYFDRPFETGDFIVVGKDMGTVKKIGIKSTRIQTLQGQELVISNKELTNIRVHNYKKMSERRVSFSFGVEYNTSIEKLREIKQIIRDILAKMEMARLDRVHFKEFGDSSLNFEVIYYVKSPDYGVFMDTQESINLEIKEKFEQHGIEFAYPTQTIYLNKSS